MGARNIFWGKYGGARHFLGKYGGAKFFGNNYGGAKFVLVFLKTHPTGPGNRN